MTSFDSSLPADSFLGRTLDSRQALIVGAGIAGCQAVNNLQVAAQAAGIDLQITWVAEHWNTDLASVGAGGWHFPFAIDDERVAEWARRSFGRHDALHRAGLSNHVQPAKSLILTRKPEILLPDGAPGPAQPVDPAGLGIDFYPRGVELDTTIVATCRAVPALQQSLLRHPGTRRLTRRFNHLGEVLELSDQIGTSTVLIAAGSGASDLVGHEEVDGDLGMLLSVPSSSIPPELRQYAFMDEDANDELTYLFPHAACGHHVIGGCSGEYYAEQELRLDSYLQHQLAREIRDRAIDRLPFTRDALRDGDYRIWWGWRPSARNVIMRWLPTSVTGSIQVLEIGGLGGSGFTISHAVVEDALLLPTDNPALDATVR